MSEQVDTPWLPGKLRVDEWFVKTDTFETYWFQCGICISDWKTERYYIDARDVSPTSFPHHPAHLLDDRFPRLQALLDATPVFALGQNVRSYKDARIFTVGFVRTADDYLTVYAEGPGLLRRLGAPFVDIERAMGSESSGYASREELIGRLLHHFSDGRLTRQSLDLAEMWLALAGGPSLFFFDGPDERMAYLRVLEEALDEAFIRAKPHEATHEAILTALRDAEQSNATRVELPALGVAHRKTIAAVKLKGKRKRSRSGDVGGVYLDFDGKSSITLPAVRLWILDRVMPKFVPASIQAWQAGAAERMRRHYERTRANAEAQQKAMTRKALLILVALVILVGAPCVYRLQKGAGGEPCHTGDDCRSGNCREIEPGRGVCLARCRPSTKCRNGASCVYDSNLQHFFCEPPVVK